MSETIFFKENFRQSFMNENQYFDIDFKHRTERINMEYQHFHSYYEIYFFIEGECSYVVEGTNYIIKPYDFILLNRYLLHKASYLNKNNKRLLINFSKEYLSLVYDEELQWILSTFENKVPIYRFDDSLKSGIIDLINEFYIYIHKNDPACQIMLRNTLLKLLYTIKNHSDKNIYSIENLEQDSIIRKMQDITMYIHSNYNEIITLNRLSKQFFISPHYLSRKFKEYTNFTVTEYIQLARLKKACELLVETNHKIIKISELCGFGSLSQFNRTFVKNKGVTPTKYRKATKDNILSLH